MSRGRRLCESIHIAALSFWLGALVVSGAAAALIFPTMKRLNPTLPDFAAYAGDHWSLAGGQIAARIFWVADAVQVACLVMAGVTFGSAIMWCGMPMQSRLTALRAALLLAVMGILSYRLGLLEPDLTEALRGYWAAASAGDNQTAARLKQTFDDAHPLQTRLMSLTAIVILAMIVTDIASLVRGPASRTPPSAQDT